MLCYKYAAVQMIEQDRGGRIIGKLIYFEFPSYFSMSVYARDYQAHLPDWVNKVELGICLLVS